MNSKLNKTTTRVMMFLEELDAVKHEIMKKFILSLLLIVSREHAR